MTVEEVTIKVKVTLISGNTSNWSLWLLCLCNEWANHEIKTCHRYNGSFANCWWQQHQHQRYHNTYVFIKLIIKQEKIILFSRHLKVVKHNIALLKYKNGISKFLENGILRDWALLANSSWTQKLKSHCDCNYKIYSCISNPWPHTKVCDICLSVVLLTTETVSKR